MIKTIIHHAKKHPGVGYIQPMHLPTYIKNNNIILFD